MNAIIEFLTKLLNGFIDQFKAKNSVAYTIFAFILGAIYYLSGEALSTTLPDGAEWLTGGAAKLVQTIQDITVVALALLGAHTPQPGRNTPVNS